MDLPCRKSFHPSRPWLLYSSSGELVQGHQEIPKRSERYFLNVHSPAYAVNKARKSFGEDRKVFFILNDAHDRQHVYHGSPWEASNAKGGYAAMKGVTNLTTWMKLVTKKAQANPSSAAPPLERAVKHIDRAMEVVGAELMTQGEFHQRGVQEHLRCAKVQASGLCAPVPVK